ncbi:hypothetical protein [Aquimarina agarilytica]|uniref:hypothetical protein n=1 Tax=Aquimarina agarilytica TaxID=1087449 RepID=UPI0003120442|nr:hypothetical protein [Aquimarina agarilytica]
MFKQIMSSEAYWRSVIRLGFLFAVVFGIVEHIGQYKGVNFDGFKADILDKGLIFRYVRSKIVGGLIYGLIVSFVFQRRKIIESRRK